MGKPTRLVLTILLFLGLGLTTSVAVAWGATARFIVQTQALKPYMAWQIKRSIIIIPALASRSESGVLHWGNYTDQAFPFWSQYHSPPREAQQRSIEIAAGWPFYSLKYSTSGVDIRKSYYLYPTSSASAAPSYDSFTQRYDGEIHGKLNLQRINKDWRNVHYLPRTPIVLYLMLDMVFWGTIWVLLFNYKTIWRLIFWLIRAPRQRCVRCGYDLQQILSDRCPECGKVFGKPPTLLGIPSFPVAVAVFLLLVIGEAIFVEHFVAQRESELIHTAAFRGDIELLKAEIVRGADVNSTMKVKSFEEHTPLLLAILSGHRENFDYLLELDVDLNYFTANMGNALTLAITHKRTEFIAKLLDAGVEISTGTGDWREPFIASIRQWDIETIKTLMNAGADVNMGGLQSSSPLQHNANWIENPEVQEIFQLLLQAGANPNPSNVRFGLPLHNAVWKNELTIVRLLLEYGADPTALDSLGKKAVDSIQSPIRDAELKALLDEYEAKWIAEHGEADGERTP